MVLITLSPLPSATRAAVLSSTLATSASTSGAPASMPLVTGVDMTLASAAFSAGDGGSDAKDPFFSSDLRLPDRADRGSIHV